MKKYLAVILSTFILLSFVACTNQGANEEISQTETEISETTEETTEETTVTTTDIKDTLEFADYIDPANSKGKDIMTLQGHSSVKIVTKSGFVIYIDPAFNDGDYSEEADLVLVTHRHQDHYNTTLVTLKEAGKIVKYEDLMTDDTYSSETIGDVTVEAVPAYNSNHAKGTGCGFILTFDDITLYHAGDTSKIDEMSSDFSTRNLTYAMLPCDGFYNMDAAEATECANIINAKYSIPMHTSTYWYDYKVAAQFTPDSKLLVEDGKTIELIP